VELICVNTVQHEASGIQHVSTPDQTRARWPSRQSEQQRPVPQLRDFALQHCGVCLPVRLQRDSHHRSEGEEQSPG
jgi:hypothetical protein